MQRRWKATGRDAIIKSEHRQGIAAGKDGCGAGTRCRDAMQTGEIGRIAARRPTNPHNLHTRSLEQPAPIRYNTKKEAGREPNHADVRYHCQKAGRRRAEPGGDRLCRQRVCGGGHPGLSDERTAHGHLPEGDDRPGNRLPHRGDGPFRRYGGPVGHSRHQGGQTFHRRRGGQDHAGDRPHRGGLRGAHCQDERPGAGPHRRHHRQDGVGSRHPHQPDPEESSAR